jgi:argonaute-like protein implicated in RNA metabolism and viral defense
MIFHRDRPAFFSSERDGVEIFAKRDGFVMEAEILAVSPFREDTLLRIAADIGLLAV